MSDKEEVTTEEPKQKPKHSSFGRVGIFIIMLALIGFAGAFCYGYFELSKVNMSLARMVTDLKQQVTETQKNLTTLQESAANSPQPAMDVAAVEHKDLNRAYIIEAQSLTRLAANHLSVARDPSTAFVILNYAQEVLQRVPNPALDPLRQALATDVASLNSAQQVNVDQIYSQLTALSYQLDKLPLPPTPLQYNAEEDIRQKDYSAAPWWKMQWHKTMDALRKIVIVRYNGGNDMPLILPEQKIFLYQNLHSQLEVVMLGLLNRNDGIYYAGLARLRTWVEKYFKQDAPETRQALNEIQALLATNIVPPPVNLAATLQMFDQYLAQNDSQTHPAVTQ